MTPRRVLLLTETFPPERGGVQEYLSSLFAALPPDTGTVIAPAVQHANTWDAAQPYHTIRARMRGFTYPRWRPAYRALEDASAQLKPSVIICGKALFEGRAARKLQRTHNVPYVVMTYAMEIASWLSGAKTRRDLIDVLLHAARVVVINDVVKRELVELGVREEAIVKMYPGVDEAFFSVDADRARAFRMAHEIEGRPLLLTTARLVPRKGIDVVLRALPEVLRQLPDLMYAIVGTGPEEASLKALARELRIEKSVLFFGDVDRPALASALAAADLFVMTPREIGTDIEGFGIVYLEAAAARVPSVASRTGGVVEAVRDGETGILVAPDDVQGTATAIRRLLIDEPALRQQYGEQARARADAEFHWAQRAFLFRGMIEAILQERYRTSS